MITILQNKRFLVLVGILAVVVSFTLLQKPKQKASDPTRAPQKITEVKLQNWNKYESSAYTMNIPDTLYLRVDNQVQDNHLTSSWSSDQNIDPENLKDGFFVTVDVEMNPKTTNVDKLIDNGFVRNCEVTPEIWTFAGLRSAKQSCDDLVTSAGKSAVIVSYSVLNDGKLFTVKAASLDTNIVDEKQLEQILDSFRFVREIDKTPKIEGNTITITVTNPHYGPNKEGYALTYEYTFTYDRKPEDRIEQITDHNINITRDAATLSISVSFDGGQIIYDKIPNPFLIHNPLSDNQIHRITPMDMAYAQKSMYDNRDYLYVDFYQENKPAMVGSNSCGSGVDPIAACSGSGVSINKNYIGLGCKADTSAIYNCDDIVKSLTVRKVGLD